MDLSESQVSELLERIARSERATKRSTEEKVMRNRLVQKVMDALIIAGGFALVSYLLFLVFECISWLWNQNEFLLTYSGF